MKRFHQKTILFAAAALLVLAGLLAGVFVLVSRRPKFLTMEQIGLGEAADVTLLADHGLSALAPANSAEAFLLAGENGCDGVRFEARRTADGVWVVLQEENIRHATDGCGRIGKITYKTLLHHRINKGSGLKNYKDDPLSVPTLEQVILICSQFNMTPVIEIKHGDAGDLEKLFDMLGYRFNQACRLVFTDDALLTKAAEILEAGSTRLEKQNVQLCREVKSLNAKALEEAKKTPDVFVCFSARRTGSARQLKRFADAGLTLCAWEVNRPKQAIALYEAGVRTFSTDKLTRREILTDESGDDAIEEPQAEPITSAERITDQ